jgi:DNA-binding protein H-NS
MNFTEEKSEELKNLQAQREALEAQIQIERNKVIADIHAIMQRHGIKPEELQEPEEPKGE